LDSQVKNGRLSCRVGLPQLSNLPPYLCLRQLREGAQAFRSITEKNVSTERIDAADEKTREDTKSRKRASTGQIGEKSETGITEWENSIMVKASIEEIRGKRKGN